MDYIIIHHLLIGMLNFADAGKLTNKIKNLLDSNIEINYESIQQCLKNDGDLVKGDHLFNDKNINDILLNCKDYRMGQDNWIRSMRQFESSNNETFEISKILDNLDKNNFRPLENITEIIVDQRLDNFGHMLSTFGFNMHLITLPEFHVTTFNMHKLSQNFANDGINAFVRTTQRQERIKSNNDHSFTYYKHQTATGTGVEAAFNKLVGSHDVNTLNDSTEQDDLKIRK